MIEDAPLPASLAKRAVDVIGATAGLVALAPLYVGIAATVRVKLGSPVLFRQNRPGLNGHPFQLVKFRTMTDCRYADGTLLPDSERLTSFGRWLRNSSLDELPELFNVLRGEMSLVGPRPLLMEYLPLYNKRQAKRNRVLPGITGWAQINGRNGISWPEKLDFDVWYVENQSLALDFRILVKTIFQVLRREGISAPGDATMPRFRGSSDDG